MNRFHHYAAKGIGSQKSESSTPSQNHIASDKTISKTAAAKIAELGLVRVAGNVFELPAEKSFWQLSKDGGIERTSGQEVDLGESIQAAPKDEPADFLQDILAGMEF